MRPHAVALPHPAIVRAPRVLAAVIRAARRRQRRRRLALATVAALAAVGAGSYLATSPGSGGHGLATTRFVEQDRLVVGLDRAGRIRTRIRLPFPPGALGAARGRIWVTDNCGCRVGRFALIDLHSHRLLADRAIGETPVDVAPDASGGAWIATFADSGITHVRR